MTATVNLWDVYYVFTTHTKPFPKNKFIVIVCFETNPMGFLINSRINQFVQKRPRLMPCEVKIEQSSHTFLAHDSFLDCRDLFPFPASELTDLKGTIDEATRIKILAGVAACPVLPRNYKDLIAKTHSEE
jgi:hypothetical protein